MQVTIRIQKPQGRGWRLAVFGLLLVLFEPTNTARLIELVRPAEPPPVIAEKVARPSTRVASFASDLAHGDPAWIGPVAAAGYELELLEKLTTASLAGVDVLLLDVDERARLADAQIDTLVVHVESGLRLVVHDPGQAHAQQLPSTSSVALPAAGPGARRTRLEPARATLLQYGPGGHLKEIPEDDFPTATAVFDPEQLPESAVPLLASAAGDGVVQMCQPHGTGALVYASVPLSPFLRARQESNAGDVLRQLYAPNLVAYAAWGACNAVEQPVAIDIVPGDPENRILRRGIQVALLSSPMLDVTTQVDQASLRFGKDGTEASLQRCSPRQRDLNRDEYPDLICVFLYERTSLGKTAERAQLRGLTHDGVPLYGAGSLILPYGRNAGAASR